MPNTLFGDPQPLQASGVSPRCFTHLISDPIHLAWMVNTFEWLATYRLNKRDPVRLVRTVNKSVSQASGRHHGFPLSQQADADD